jgi:hypothetical protein
VKVYVLMGSVAYEGDDILEVFAKEEAAQAALKPLESWVNSPRSRNAKEYSIWHDSCPRAGCDSYDRFFIATAQVTE